KLPGNFPIGLAALLLGTAIGWAGGFMDADAVTQGAKDIAVGLPNLNFDLLSNGLDGISPLLATAIPLGIYNFTEAMSNVESAAAAGDSYNLRHVLLADGTGAIVGSCLGSPFPPAVYVGQPGWKAAGGGISYSLVTGVGIFALCTFGMFPLLGAILPTPAIVPVLLYIGLVIGAQAFGSVPKAYYPAIVLACVPNLASWAVGLVDNALSAAGTSAAEVGNGALGQAGVVYNGLHTLGNGAVLAGMVLGAIAVFMIDRRFVWAAGYSFFAAALACVGLIHGDRVHLFESPKIGLGYALMGVVLLALHYLKIPEREVDESDAADVAEVRPTIQRTGRFDRSPSPQPAAVAASVSTT
ncbi:MAG: adenine/guanine/hypoxanthine permease, partial [Solirubrobacteraceae bacterium]|nr:adenine/guanine/hypoxanthine permease [Solirubrobacteraceae bacterium]